MVVTPNVAEVVWVPALRLLIGTAVGLVAGSEKENWLRLGAEGAPVGAPETAELAPVGAGAAEAEPLAGAEADAAEETGACLGWWTSLALLACADTMAGRTRAERRAYLIVGTKSQDKERKERGGCRLRKRRKISHVEPGAGGGRKVVCRVVL